MTGPGFLWHDGDDAGHLDWVEPERIGAAE